MVNLPVFFTSVVASTARPSSNAEQSFFSTPLLEDRASTIAVLVMAGADFFIPFFAFMTCIAFTMTEVREKSKCEWPYDFPVS